MKVWEDLLSTLEKDIGKEAVDQWLRPIKIVRFDAGNIYLDAAPFQQVWFEEQVKPRIGKLFNNNERHVKIHWEKNQNNKKSFQQTAEFRVASDPIDDEMNLDLFLPSVNNTMASQMAYELTQTGKCSFNPLFFSGPSSSGKTHILMGIASKLIKLGKKVFYVRAQSFTEHVVQAIRLSQMTEFRKSYREIDVLIVDDVHVFARKNATQEEFFHTFNALHTLNRQIILSAETNPQLLPDIEPRLISRFEWGISLNLTPPDEQMLRSILKQKAKNLQLTPSDELIDFLIERFRSKISAPIIALHAIAIRCPQSLNLFEIEKNLSDLLQKEAESILTTEKIIKETAHVFGIGSDDLTGASQMREHAQPRQIAMFLCRQLLQMPFQSIGRTFNRDHSTVMSSVKQVQAAIEQKQSPYFETVSGILRKLGRGALKAPR